MRFTHRAAMSRIAPLIVTPWSSSQLPRFHTLATWLRHQMHVTSSEPGDQRAVAQHNESSLWYHEV
eukprot:2557436-Amphidinium_carterae.1